MKVYFFASVSEITGVSQIEQAGFEELGDLISELEQTYPELRRIKYAVAVNHEIVSLNKVLSPDDEIALLPPFSGG